MLRAMAKKEPRKPLRERVAERKAKEAAKAGLPPPGETLSEDEADAKARASRRLLWERIAMTGTVLQWLAMVAVIVQGYMLWVSTSAEPPKYGLIIVFAVVFVFGRALRMVGADQMKKIR